MQWIGRRESTNVEDRRGISGGGIAAGGGILGLIIYLLVNFLGGGSGDSNNLPEIPSINNSRNLSPEEQKEDEERAKFVKVVLADTEDIWSEIFQKNGKQYQAPVLVLFRDGVQS